MTWAARLAALSKTESPNADSADSVVSPQNIAIDTIDTIDTTDIGVFPKKLLSNDPPASVPCVWCGTASAPFAFVINADLWLCSVCLPGDPDEQAVRATETAAMAAGFP